jgi:hypothetical protein
MKDSFPFKIYTQSGLIISECSTMSEAIARAEKLNCKWDKLPGKQVGQLI